jgi:probable F420-dependent oxidoreductase
MADGSPVSDGSPVPIAAPRDPLDPLAGIHLGIALPQTADDQVDLSARIRRFSRAAERLGFDGLWARDRIQGREPLIEPLTALATAATATKRVRLGVAVVLVPLRAPIELARTSASLDRLSGGRLELGIGLGVDRERVRSVGLDPGRRVARLLDSVDVLRAMWSGESVTVEGRTLTVRDWMVRPTPQQPRPRIWFGGHHPDALRRAVHLGDGWIEAGSTSHADFVREIAIVREHLDAAGRDESTFGLGKRLYLAVERRGRNTRQDVRRWFDYSYGREEMADRVAAVGSPARIADAVLEVLAQRARLVILHPVPYEAPQLRVLADEVVPAVREALRTGVSSAHGASMGAARASARSR